MKIYAHNKFAISLSHTIISCERTRICWLKFTVWRRKTYPGSFWRSTLEAPEGCGLSASIFPTTTTKQEIGQRIPTRGYYIRIGSWWVVIWRHLELASMPLIDCELVVVRDWSTKISLATPLEAIIEVTHRWMWPAFLLCPSPSLSGRHDFHWTAFMIPSRNCQSLWQLIRLQTRISYPGRLRTWFFILQIFRFRTREA